MNQFVCVVTMLVLVGCGKSATKSELAQRCDRALGKVLLIDQYNEPGSTMSAGERAILDQLRSVSQSQCEEEGLTKEQAACFENVRDIATLLAAAECPAIVAAQPSWFRVPPPDMRREVLKKLRNDRVRE